ncbi:MAG TPA: acyl-CoA dehydrogenase family protein [Dehalococcoidia bacterium]|nr:acyl-CoA dehydrogenase family protein [Dehalococcoidia bacterium]
MQFRFSPEDEAFRSEVQTFLKENWGDEPDDDSDEGMAAIDRRKAFEKKMAAEGLLTMHWPRAYGGRDASRMQQLIMREEMARVGAMYLDAQGVGMVGPVLMIHGTEDQRKRFLPDIANGDVVWCQGFSEPNSGSDLASLQCRAVKDGDDYVINGQKIWTSQAKYADWIHVLCRTDQDAPKHKGITYFAVEMSSPGITVNPIVNMMGEDGGFAETIFEDVRVPRSHVMGEENRGWYVATTTLDFERSNIGFTTQSRRTLESLAAFAKETRANGKTLLDQPAVRNKLADLLVAVEVARLLSYRVTWMQDQNQVPNYEASMVKTFGTELRQRISNFGVNLLGPYGQLEAGSKHEKLAGALARDYQWTTAETIYGGSSEIQRNIIATRGLGLPRG